MKSNIKEIARFDVRLAREQKDFFEKVAIMGAYRNFSDFVIQALQEKANKIIKEKEQIISSEKDANIFFEEILKSSSPPNLYLKSAFEEYKSELSK